MTSTHRLVLLRHAKAEPGGSIADHLRPLALRGRQQATGVGQSLLAVGLVPDRVLVSSAVRTRQTWDLVRGVLGLDPSVATVADEVYDAGVRELLALVQGTGEDVGTLLVVGHEPTVSQTAALLAGPGSDDDTLLRVQVGVPTATTCELEAATPWAQWAPHAVPLRSVVSPV